MLAVQFNFLSFPFFINTLPLDWVQFAGGATLQSLLRVAYLWEKLFEEIESIVMLLMIQIKELSIHLILKWLL